jgi:hypothetical protein
MESTVMESSTAPTPPTTAVEAAGRHWCGEGEGQHRHERHTEDLLHDRLRRTSVDLREVYAESGDTACAGQFSNASSVERNRSDSASSSVTHRSKRAPQ